MVVTAPIAPQRASHRPGRGRLTVLVGPGVDPRRLARALVDRWTTLPPASLHVVAVDSAVPLWAIWAEGEPCLVGSVWDLYEECHRGEERCRAERLAAIVTAVDELGVAATYETFVGPLRTALRQAPARWPGPVVVAGLRPLLRRRPDGVDQLAL